MVATIRPASIDDADAVGHVHVRAWRSAYRGLMPDDYLDGLHASEHAERWRRHLEAVPSDSSVFVVVEDRQVVGYTSVGPAHDDDALADTGQLYVINLDPDVWGRGLGRKLLHAATDRLGHLGYREGVLWVVPDNARARRFYEADGWTDDAVRRNDEVFGVAVTEMRYRRPLETPPGERTQAPTAGRSR